MEIWNLRNLIEEKYFDTFSIKLYQCFVSSTSSGNPTTFSIAKSLHNPHSKTLHKNKVLYLFTKPTSNISDFPYYTNTQFENIKPNYNKVKTQFCINSPIVL